ncbi:MAG: aminotransferase class V-fold PLP-dependent enzyme, partial [Gemmatimonadota bacterium]
MKDAEVPYDLDGWRRRIPLLGRFIALNNCSQSPQTDRTRAAAEAWLESWNRDGMDWGAWMEEVRLAKAEFARLIHAAEEEIAVTTSVSAATASLASAIEFSPPRDRVLVSGAEFPTVGHVWLAHRRAGARIDRVPVEDGVIEPEAWERALNSRIRLVSACHGYFQNGFRQDIGRIAERAHAAGAWIYVDAYQTLGTCPLDVKALDIDFLASGALKYLMGTPGIA